MIQDLFWHQRFYPTVVDDKGCFRLWMLSSSLFPVIPLNIGLLNVFGRKMTLMVLQLLSAIFFMMLNICTTM